MWDWLGTDNGVLDSVDNDLLLDCTRWELSKFTFEILLALANKEANVIPVNGFKMNTDGKIMSTAVLDR